MTARDTRDIKWAVVTGASRGIGAAIASRLADDGFGVTLVGRDLDGLTRTRGAIDEHRGVVETDRCDLSSKASLGRCAKKLMRHHPVLHVLVNNAGVSYSAPFAQQAHDHFDAVWSVNVNATFELTRLLLPALTVARPSASVVNISSVLGTLAMPFEAAYIASKGAINQLTKALAVELGPAGVRVNAVAPGFIQTEMFTRSHNAVERAAIARAHPMGRVGDPSEVAAAVSFLCSSSASFISGTVLAVDGGLASSLAYPCRTLDLRPDGETS